MAPVTVGNILNLKSSFSSKCHCHTWLCFILWPCNGYQSAHGQY